MLKRENLWKPILLLFGALGLLLTAASFWDEAISSLLYTGTVNSFGSTVAAVGELPSFTLFAMAGVTWLLRRGRSRRWKEWFALFGGTALILLGVFLSFRELKTDLPRLSYVDCGILTAVLYAAVLPLGVLLTRNASRSDCFRFVLSVLLVCGVSMLAVHVLKYVWARPRPWYLAQESAAQFVPWWQPGIAKYPAGAAFKASRSFPSGHTAAAACSLLWTLFPALHRRFEGRGRVCLFCSVFFTALVALSRLTVGAHFLSDVVLTWLMVSLLYLLSQLLFYRDSTLFVWLYRFLT